MSWFIQHNVLPLERFSLLAKPAMRPRMFLRALRPPMVLGASLPGMIFPAQRPAKGSDSYHYGSHATLFSGRLPISSLVSIPLWFSRNEKMAYSGARSPHCFHTTMVLTQLLPPPIDLFLFHVFPYHYGSHATRVYLSLESQKYLVSIPLWFSRNFTVGRSRHLKSILFPYHYGSHATVEV